MGKKNKNRNKKHVNRAKSNGNWTQDRVVGFDKVNEKFFEYYKRQALVPEAEWDAFVETLKRDLPVSFRIQGCHKDRGVLQETLEKSFFAPIAAAAGEAAVYEPGPLLWYDGAYQTAMSRSQVRSHPVLAKLHNFLVTEAELGHISRQEAVSMIPPLLLAPLPEHAVLDVCAAPGSKTLQLIEIMHEKTPNPSGFVVANDVDKNRCYLLCHQILKRMKSDNCVVICEDGAIMPSMIDSDGSVLKFDRVLCDVICSGDGTLRKNPDIWKSWTPQEGIGLHKLQLSIARRSAQQLKVGGLMVYSTCSMNPLEDEAVVAQLLRESGGSLRLVDAHPRLPHLKACRGTSSWKVIDRDMKEYPTVADIPAEGPIKKALVPSMWPPAEEEATQLHLEYTMRILPHLQDTGGFFVALLERAEEEKPKENEDKRIVKAPGHKRLNMFKDEPFTFLKKEDPRWADIKEYYGISDDFPYENLFNRMLENENSRQLFFVNTRVKHFIEKNMKTLSIQNAGMKMFGRNENKVETVRFRISQEGVSHLLPFLTKQKVKVSREDMVMLLKEEAKGPEKKIMVDMERLAAKDEIRAQNSGSVVLFVDEQHPVCAWVGQRTAAPYVGKEEKVHLLRLLGVDTDSIEALMKTTRKEKAMRDREEAHAEKRKAENDNGDVDGGEEANGKRARLEDNKDISSQVSEAIEQVEQQDTKDFKCEPQDQPGINA